MLIQVTTNHGKSFRRAGLVFGPRPTRLWVGKGKSPDPRLQIITGEQLEKLDQATGDHGPLIVERDVPHLYSKDAEAELAALRAEREALEQANQNLHGALSALQADHDKVMADHRELRGLYDAAMDRIHTLEQAAVDIEQASEKPAAQPKPNAETKPHRNKR